MEEKTLEKLPFDVDAVFALLREAVKPYPPAAMFALCREGYCSLFEQLAGCIISIRTRDEETMPVARRLFSKARTPEELLRLSVDELDALIVPSTFHRGKADRLLHLARIAVDRYGGNLPADEAVLLSLPGVGPKCAHLALGVACGRPYVSVDIHVFRVTGRWGIVRASTPEKAETELTRFLPEADRVELNALLVPFGKHICTGTLPRCSVCPLLNYCGQVGVDRHR